MPSPDPAAEMFTADTIYVQVFQSRFMVRNIDSGASVETARDQSFASPRMLIADFTVAEFQLKQAVKQVRRGLRAPQMILHPMELIEGGVTQVEYRAFVELGMGAGAWRIGVYSDTREALSDDQVRTVVRGVKNWSP